MTEELFREAVKNDGWIIKRKGGYIYFKRRDLTKPDNQGAIYSCHTKDMQEAIATIKNWIINGYPKTRAERTAEEKSDVFFVDYLYSFWNLESLYFKTAAYEGRRITISYIEQNRRFIRIYVESFFSGLRLSQITEKKLNDFFDWLIAYVSPKTSRPLARGTIARLKACIVQPLKWGRQKGIVKQSLDFLIVFPSAGKKAEQKRGILTPEETAVLLAHKWDEKKAYIAFCIAVNCGLRVGEIRALKIGSIRNGFLIVSHSFSDYDGFKCTKNGKTRIVPCPDDVLELIAGYIESLPPEERKDDCYLLTHDFKEGQPLYPSYCRKKFYKAMRQCGISKVRINPITGEKETICFHSLRHQTATRWVESGLDLRLIAQAMGHTIKMLEHYSDHYNISDMQTLRRGLTARNSLGAGRGNQLMIESDDKE